MTAGLRVAVAIPAFQAAPSIGDVVRRTLPVLPDVLVIDDGSDDGTAGEAERAGAELLSHQVNQGKGTALRNAFATLFARGFDAVLTLDADGQHLPEQIPALLQGLHQHGDLVLGTREHLFSAMGRVRRISNRLSSGVISLVAGARVTDVQTGFRIYTRRLVETVGFPEARFEAESAVVVRTVRHGLRIVTVPVELGFADGRCTSHYRPLLDSLRITRAVIRARIERRRPVT